jgi:hypothetical protein
MAPQPRWTVPVNIRQQDKSVLDAALTIAESDRTDITTVFRNALAEYVKARSGTQGDNESRKIDEYLDSSFRMHSKLLTPEDLKRWTDSDVLTLAKQIRSRRQELDFELRKRGYFFQW